MRILVWVVRGLVFFVLFAFALNNQHETSVRWFFGREWRAPMVFVVLATFALGCAFGVSAMVPSWWRHRRLASRHRAGSSAQPSTTVGGPGPEPVVDHPPRDGL